MQNDIEQLRNKHVGQIAWIVAKGPSLLELSPLVFGPGPVITINQAVRKIATLHLPNIIYSMQKDGASPFVNVASNGSHCPHRCADIVDDQCPVGQTQLTHGEILLVHRYHSFCCWPDYVPRYEFDSGKWGFHKEIPSAPIALKIALLFGCKTVVMVAFDGMFCADARIVEDGLSIIGNGSLNYIIRQPAHVNPVLAEFESVFWLSPGQIPLRPWPEFYKSNHVPEPPVTQNRPSHTRRAINVIPPQQNSPQLGGQKRWRG